MNVQSETTVAIVIAVRSMPERDGGRRLRTLQACLQSVLAAVALFEEAWKGAREVQVVVVDDRSEPPVERQLEDAGLAGVRVLRNDDCPGQGGALNAALVAVHANRYAFTDSDCVVAEDWLLLLDQRLSTAATWDGVAGPNWLYLEADQAWSRWLSRQASALTAYSMRSYLSPDQELVKRFDCRSLMLRRRVFENRSGAFFSVSGPSVSWQTALEQVVHGDLTIGYEPNSLVWHEPVASLWEEFRRYYRWGRQGQFHTYYARGWRGLSHAFFRRYAHRHFLAPLIGEKVHPLYLWLVHGAYWAGIVNARMSG